MSEEFQNIVKEFEDSFFGDELPDDLPPKREAYFEIKLKSDSPPPVCPVISLSNSELEELEKKLQVLLSKGLILPSSSPFGAPVFFVKNKKGIYEWCVTTEPSIRQQLRTQIQSH